MSGITSVISGVRAPVSKDLGVGSSTFGFPGLENLMKRGGGIFSNPWIWLLVGAVILGVIIYYMYKSNKTYEANNPILLGYTKDAKVPIVVDGSKLPKTQVGDEWSYSFWLFISDYDYLYNQTKSILTTGQSNGFSVAPGVFLGPQNSDLLIKVNSLITPSSDITFNGEDLVIRDLPLQRWISVVLTYSNKVVSLYLNGKLTKSKVLDSPAINLMSSKVSITPNGGFSGQIGNVQFFNHELSPYDIYRIYILGNDSSFIPGVGKLFSWIPKLHITVTVDEPSQGPGSEESS
jgi:hypothetical protein